MTYAVADASRPYAADLWERGSEVGQGTGVEPEGALYPVAAMAATLRMAVPWPPPEKAHSLVERHVAAGRSWGRCGHRSPTW